MFYTKQFTRSRVKLGTTFKVPECAEVKTSRVHLRKGRASRLLLERWSQGKTTVSLEHPNLHGGKDKEILRIVFFGGVKLLIGLLNAPKRRLKSTLLKKSKMNKKMTLFDEEPKDAVQKYSCESNCDALMLNVYLSDLSRLSRGKSIVAEQYFSGLIVCKMGRNVS
ncbi:Uncharacterized protein Fot_14719 [Forsythia ovata]|uniref:Uncharacterized protein n=1 Tax=Forsythia ovata TaxID=205694 RepID=A0ABD1W748_9LAMI